MTTIREQLLGIILIGCLAVWATSVRSNEHIANTEVSTLDPDSSFGALAQSAARWELRDDTVWNSFRLFSTGVVSPKQIPNFQYGYAINLGSPSSANVIEKLMLLPESKFTKFGLALSGSNDEETSTHLVPVGMVQNNCQLSPGACDIKFNFNDDVSAGATIAAALAAGTYDGLSSETAGDYVLYWAGSEEIDVGVQRVLVKDLTAKEFSLDVGVSMNF